MMRYFEGGPCSPYIVWGQGYRSKESNPSRLQLLYPWRTRCLSNQLGFLDRQVVFACFAQFVEQFRDPRGLFWRIGPPRLARPMWSHEGIRVYTPTISLGLSFVAFLII
jgi:hypothetical protein